MAPKKSTNSGEQIQCPTLKLTVDKGPLSGQTLEFGSRSRIQIGRVVRGNTLSIKDGGISSKHLLIEFESGSNKWAITDLDSSNGTFLNGSLLEPSESTGLSDGDVIKIGEKTSMRVTFEAGGGVAEGNGGDVRRNTRRRGRNRGGELGVIDEDLELGLEGGRIGNVINRVLGDEVEKLVTDELGLEVENGVKGGLGSDDGKLGNDDGVKVIGRRTRGAPKAKDSKTQGEVVEDKVVSAKNSKKGVVLEVLEVEDDADKEVSENVGGVEGKRGRNVSWRTTRSSKKNLDSSKIQGEEGGQRGVQEEQRVSVRRTRSSRKEETFIDLSVVEGKRKTRGAKEKSNLSTETPLEEEKNDELNVEHEMPEEEEEKRKSVAGDDEPVEEVQNTYREGAAGVASTSGVKDGVGEFEKGSLYRDLDGMTLGEWFDFLEVFLPKQIIDATEDLISEMRQKAERVHEFKMQQKNAK